MTVITCLVLLGTMQVMAATIKPYKPQKQNQPVRQEYQVMPAAPSATFQSTSTMSGSGSQYSANPSLNENGTAAYSAAEPARVSGPRRNPGIIGGDEGENEGSGGTGIDDGTEVEGPLGDAVLPLMLMAIAFCGMVYMRKRKTA